MVKFVSFCSIFTRLEKFENESEIMQTKHFQFDREMFHWEIKARGNIVLCAATVYVVGIIFVLMVITTWRVFSRVSNNFTKHCLSKFPTKRDIKSVRSNVRAIILLDRYRNVPDDIFYCGEWSIDNATCDIIAVEKYPAEL